MQINWRKPLHWWRFALGVALAALLSVGVVQITHLPVFQLHRIQVVGAQHVNLAQTQWVIQQYAHGSLFSVDLEQVRIGFGKLPWVRTVDVRRKWPDGLVVTLQEQQPLARWNGDALLNLQGEVYVAASDADLPQLSGPEDSHLWVAQMWRRLAGLLQPIGRKPVALALNARQSWQMTLDNGVVIKLGRDQPEARLARWVLLYPAMMTQLDAPLAKVDLRYPQGFAVQLAPVKSPAQAGHTQGKLS